MGFVLSIVYFVTNYLTPAYLFGSLADLRIELILSALIVLVSLPPLLNSFVLKIPQSLAIIGLTIVIFISVLIGSRGFEGAVQMFLLFLPSGVSFFFVCLHFNTRKRLKILVLMMFLVCVFVIGHGVYDLSRGIPQNGEVTTTVTDPDLPSNTTASPYFIKERTSDTDVIYRLQGLGEINDPNDFGQLLVCTIPLVFIFWHEKKLLTNVFFVFLPACILLFGAYLTHSRGALVALTAVAIVAARRRIGIVPASIVAGILVVAAMSLHFTGGRDISASAGEDRTALWGEALQMLKIHPFFGVGFEGFGQESGLTAHNSIAVCASELGLFGLYFWSLYLFPTMRDSLAISSPKMVSEAEPTVEESRFSDAIKSIEEIDKAEINRLGQLMFLSLTGFLVAGWFLSRAFIMTLFLLGGMTEAVYQMALKRGMVAPRWRHERVLPYSGALAVGLVVLLYITVRVLNFSR